MDITIRLEYIPIIGLCVYKDYWDKKKRYQKPSYPGAERVTAEDMKRAQKSFDRAVIYTSISIMLLILILDLTGVIPPQLTPP
jgi:cobalamin biosynthesis protein CobD/CbiB